MRENEETKSRVLRLLAASLAAACAFSAHGQPAPPAQTPATVAGAVNAAIAPVMQKYAIPGMAVGVTLEGQRYLFDYGVASLETRKPVTRETLFELGSVSKTFTATLAAYAQASGRLDLSDPVEKFLPELRGSKFGAVPLLELGTHTPGGLPLQVPDNIKNRAQLMQYFRDWQPAYAPGTTRTYSNPGIGMLGLITAKSMGGNFEALVRQRLLRPLGLSHTFITVPRAERANYAQGYTYKGAPIRMVGDVLSYATYGVKSSAADVLRFVEFNLDPAGLEPTLARALTATRTGYYQAGAMTQDLIWEQYPYPTELQTLLANNAGEVALAAMPVTALRPPQPPRDDVLVDKLGSTNGFGSYVVFVPQKKFGIVILANKSYPNEERVKMAHQVMTALVEKKPGG